MSTDPPTTSAAPKPSTSASLAPPPDVAPPPPVTTQAATDPGPRPFILASRSPRRIELLREAGYEFSVDPADVDESNYPKEMLPSDVALRLASLKAEAVAARHASEYVLAADTVVAFGDLVIGKPDDAAHARKILRLLAGTTHIVITGVALARLDSGFAQARRVMSVVRMKNLTDREIDRYIETGEWRGKAGAYGIQDNDPFVERIAGCHTNIVGLPMTTTKAMLGAVGIVGTR